MNEKKHGGKIRTLIAVILFTVAYSGITTLVMANYYNSLWVYAITAAVLYVLELAAAKILKVNRLPLSLSPLFATAIALIIFLVYPYPDLFSLFKEMLFFCFVRAGISIIDFISVKKYKFIPLSFALCAVFLFSLDYSDVLHSKYMQSVIGTPDKTGSWGAINQNVQRSESWQEFVTDTPFTLGNISETPNEFDEYECSLGSYPAIDGSTVCVPMAVEFARQHLNMDDYCANSMASFSTTHYAYESLIQNDDNYYSKTVYAPMGEQKLLINTGSADLIIATEPSDEELALAESYGVTLIKKPVCYDAFVFITHKDNPVESLTVEQIRDIYSGKIKNWKEVGGKNEKIAAFQREKNSGSQTAMENLVMGGSEMIDPIEIKTIVGMGELVDAVAEYENDTASIGYTYRYYIDTLYKNDNIKTISVDGIAPTDENIRNKTYTFTTNYYGVIRKGEENDKGGKFLDWILSDEGQKCVGQAGYITLK